MKKLFVLFISLILIFSFTFSGFANEDLAVQVGDESLSEEDLNVRIDKSANTRDPHKRLEPHEIVSSFVLYALVKNTIERVKPRTDMDKIHEAAEKKLDEGLKLNDMGMGEVVQNGPRTEKQIMEGVTTSVVLEVLNQHYHKEAKEFVNTQMVDEILNELNFELKLKNKEEINKKIRQTLVQIKKADLVRSAVFEEYQKGFTIYTNKVDKEKVTQNLNF